MSLLLVDTNLLLVAVVAAVAPEYVARVGRTRAYTIQDVTLLDAEVSKYDSLLVTPHVLTEVSNLAGQISEPLRAQIRALLAWRVPQWAEVTESSSDVVGDPLFRRIGETDAAIRRAAGPGVTDLTDDLPLYDTPG